MSISQSGDQIALEESSKTLRLDRITINGLAPLTFFHSSESKSRTLYFIT